MKDINDNDFNEKQSLQYETLMDKSKPFKEDFYWDRNNLFIRIILIILFFLAIIGVSYYIHLWFINK